MIKPILPVGTKHGRLTVVAFERDPNDPKHPRYRCRCECGTEIHVQRGNLPRTHSCGCIKREMLKAKATHGMRHTPEYRLWADMINRCGKTTGAAYANYGARGITVCQEWRDSFERFYAALGPRPTPKHTLERIDNDGNYKPGNCRWATRKDQRINQRRMVLYTLDGVTGTVKDLALHFGANRHTVHDRMWRLGWDIRRAIDAGVHVKSKQTQDLS
jgi:hypothetical protein